MRYSFRLAELLGHVPDPRKRPGTIKAIVEHTGLDRHQVAALLKNEVKYIPLKALSRLCDYLVAHGYVAADQLPGALFAVEPESFWELLARRRRLELCLGVRMDQPDWPEVALVMASDSLLLGELLNGVSTLGGTAKLKRAHDTPGMEAINEAIPHPEHLKQSLVWSPGQQSDEEVRSRAREVHDELGKWAGDKALVCLGSTKSNPVVELVIAKAFGGEPFHAQDEVDDPAQRHCPFFLRYRDSDPHPSSCCGGSRLAKHFPLSEPGLYFEQADGTWACSPWDKAYSDVALVFYIHRESQGWLEMVLGGFSGRATRLLAQTLATGAQDFWPPVFAAHGIEVGAFVVQFKLNSAGDFQQDILRTDFVAATEVIPLDPATIQRRLKTPP